MTGGDFIPGFCLHRGCPEPALDGSNWCAFHQPEAMLADALRESRTLSEDEPVLALFELLRDALQALGGMVGLARGGVGELDPTPARDPHAIRQLHCAASPRIPRPTQTAPGDHRLSELGYRLVKIEVDPITRQDIAWLWQRPDPPDDGEC